MTPISPGEADQDDHGLLRFFTCGSVDDGKSTLIGRLLYDAGLVPDDQIAALPSSSAASADGSVVLDFSHLLDGLNSEREQGITIDVAYRYFSTPKRKFIVADTPGHEQYTRNMVTGASVCELALLLIDARKGVLQQTKRHSAIVGLLEVPHVVLAVNKMDLIGYSFERFEEIVAEYRSFAASVGLPSVTCIPLCALTGENLVHRSRQMDWYTGPTLLDFLEGVDPTSRSADRPFRMPVQWINRPNQDFRGLSGMVACGTVSPGQRVTVMPSGQDAVVKQVIDAAGPASSAGPGCSVTLQLAQEVDVARGDVVVASDDHAEVADQLAADIVWMSEEPMMPGRRYLIKCGTQTVPGSISRLRYKLDVDSLEHVATTRLELNEIGNCNLDLRRPIVFEPYTVDRTLGSFIIIDRVSSATIGAGLIRFGLRRASSLQLYHMDVDRPAREKLLGQKACCLWFTGLSGAGKSTIANLLEKRLHAAGRSTYVLDGDNVRHGLNRDLGFTEADRVENIRRVGEVARLMVDAGLIVIVSFISPFRAERQMARELFSDGQFIEVFVDTPLDVCEARDPKGLYQKARGGLIPNFTGIDSPYEPPDNPELHLDSAHESPEALAEKILSALNTIQVSGDPPV